MVNRWDTNNGWMTIRALSFWPGQAPINGLPRHIITHRIPIRSGQVSQLMKNRKQSTNHHYLYTYSCNNCYNGSSIGVSKCANMYVCCKVWFRYFCTYWNAILCCGSSSFINSRIKAVVISMVTANCNWFVDCHLVAYLVGQYYKPCRI